MDKQELAKFFGQIGSTLDSTADTIDRIRDDREKDKESFERFRLDIDGRVRVLEDARASARTSLQTRQSESAAGWTKIGVISAGAAAIVQLLMKLIGG